MAADMIGSVGVKQAAMTMAETKSSGGKRAKMMAWIRFSMGCASSTN